MFERELQKLYHAEIEILDLHSDLAAAADSDEIRAIFSGHEGDTVEQIDRIEAIFATLDSEPRERGSPIMEGLLAEKDEFVEEVEDVELRELDVLSIGMINERLEITLLDRLLLLAEGLDLPDDVVSRLETNRTEAKTALEKMQSHLDKQRVGHDQHASDRRE
ncbi:DUF892 family protein [Halomarina halobia]|uniref:DUF892 family protein n=2 Tax=Halomarina halobia TaxID=3033386 RepID=A0ABD6A770_9EURY